MQRYSKPILGLSAIRSEQFAALLHDYEEDLVRAGYNLHVRRLHLQTLAHFGVWLDRAGVASGMIDEDTVAAFERHRPRCRCPGTSRNRGRHVVSARRGCGEAAPLGHLLHNRHGQRSRQGTSRGPVAAAPRGGRGPIGVPEDAFL